MSIKFAEFVPAHIQEEFSSIIGGCETRKNEDPVFQDIITRITKLSTNELMKDVYSDLEIRLSKDELEHFMFNAWFNFHNFNRSRKNKSEASKKNKSILKYAKGLKKALKGLEHLGYGDRYYYCVAELLERAEKSRGNEINLPWQYELAKLTTNEDARVCAPYITDLIDAFIECVENCEYTNHKYITHESRENNQKTQFIRSFCKEIIKKHGHAKTITLKRSIATITNVLLHDEGAHPSIDGKEVFATTNDVTKIINQLAPKNSLSEII